MTRRGVYQLELVAAVALIGGVCLVSILAVLGMKRPAADDWKPAGPGVTIVNIKAKGIGVEAISKSHYVGIAAGGCAAANCHGGVQSSDENGQTVSGDEWKTSAFQFLQHDPHAQAYNVLFEERSRKMIDRLARGDEALATGKITPPGNRSDVLWYAAQLQKRCVSCHATPLPEGTASNAEAGLNHYALGVTCEACHGRASQWGDQHLSARWQTISSREIENPIDKKATGFHELESLSVAAATCAKCHIGDGGQFEGMEYRAVTHDLIAAGHPRLDFDFSAWYSSMPPHWNREREQRESFNTDAWVAGQNESLNTTVQRVFQALALRERAAKESSNIVAPPWPEFANFDCFACHRALQFPPSAIAAPASPSIPFGSSWRVFGRVHEQEVAQTNEKLGALFESNLFAAYAPKLKPLIGLTPNVLGQSLADYPRPKSWDELLSWYYAADAVSRDADFAAQSSPNLQGPATTVEAILRRLKSEMEKYLARSGEVSRYASPSGFGVAKVDADDTAKPDPQAVQMAFEEAKQAVGALAEKWER